MHTLLELFWINHRRDILVYAIITSITGPFPIKGVRIPMFDWVVMNVIEAVLEVILISGRMFPKTSLPDT